MTAAGWTSASLWRGGYIAMHTQEQLLHTCSPRGFYRHLEGGALIGKEVTSHILSVTLFKKN